MMSNPLYAMMNAKKPPIFQQIEQLKNIVGGDPNAKIQELLNSGKVTQQQYNQAVQQAQQMMNIFKH